MIESFLRNDSATARLRTATKPPWSSRRGILIGFALTGGILVTPPALFLAALSAGAGYGDYGFALWLFPIPMCIAAYITGSIGAPSIVVAVVQFPIYLAALAYSATLSRKSFAITAATLGLAHFLAVAICDSSSWLH